MNVHRHFLDRSSDRLKITCWNVNGLSKNSVFDNKLQNSDFIRQFHDSDVSIMSEIWGSEVNEIPGFDIIALSPPRKLNTKKSKSTILLYQSFFSETGLENSREIPAKSAIFSANLSLKIPRNLTFFSATYQKPCLMPVVARNETGRLSLKLNILLRIIKFWIHLESLPENSIANQCLIISNQLTNEAKTSFMLTVNEIIRNYKDIHHQSWNKTIQANNIRTIKNNLQKIKCHISNNLKRHQLELIRCNRKLCFYS